MTIKINGVDYNLQYTLRGLFIFEQICNKPFEIKTLLDNYVFFYSLLLASNKNKEVPSFDEFIDALDNDKTLFEQINKLITDKQEEEKLFANDEGEDEKKVIEG